ncbi:MAG TPA: FliH/SctL family protein [Paenibacillaceae bacterium]
MSNLYKSSQVITLEELKRLEVERRMQASLRRSVSDRGTGPEGGGILPPDVEAERNQVLRDAERLAGKILQEAREEADRLKAAAQAEIEAWWQARREEDAVRTEEARRAGHEEGYREGLRLAEEEVRRQWEERLAQARELVEQAYRAKENIIAESERFLVDLACGIAGKIVGKQLADAPELALRLIAEALSRRKEQGVITLCVSPDQFAFVHAARDELASVMDSQAELHILPDPAVKNGGCIVRSSFGSIDARVDTQLAAIREALLQVAAAGEEAGECDGGQDA